MGRHSANSVETPKRLSQSARTYREVCAYVELHVEQGGVLERAATSIGVVEGIVGIQYVDVVLIGRANHAGTTPMELRRDALVAASRFVLAIDEAMRSGDFCRVGTVGTLHVVPNARNVVPGEVRMTVGLRDLDTGAIDRALEHLRQRADDISRLSQVELKLEESERMDPAAADPELMRAVVLASERLGLSPPHDAQRSRSRCTDDGPDRTDGDDFRTERSRRQPFRKRIHIAGRLRKRSQRVAAYYAGVRWEVINSC